MKCMRKLVMIASCPAFRLLPAPADATNELGDMEVRPQRNIAYISSDVGQIGARS